MNPHAVTKEFEKAVSDYTNSPYVVCVNSCTMALRLCLDYLKPVAIEIPKLTYVSVPMQIIQSGAKLSFRDEDWQGMYQLSPTPIYDSARRFRRDMYAPGTFQCVSFHAQKILGDSQGGAILHDNHEADQFFRRARLDGRTEGVSAKDDEFTLPAHHCYLSPDIAARLSWKLQTLPDHNEDLPRSDYADLSQKQPFKDLING